MDFQLRVIKVHRDGKRRFDPGDKERLISACLEPGVSLAKLALDHGVNANQLRTWVTTRRSKGGKEIALAEAPGYKPSVFIPAVKAAPAMAGRSGDGALATGRGVEPSSPRRQDSIRARLKVEMANGVKLELEGGDAQMLSALIEALGRCDVPAGA